MRFKERKLCQAVDNLACNISIYFALKNLVLWARSEFYGYA